MAARSASTAAFGRAVRDLRQQRSISQEELSFRAGMDRSFVGRIERGANNPTYETLIKLAAGLRVAAPEIVVLAERYRLEAPGDDTHSP